MLYIQGYIQNLGTLNCKIEFCIFIKCIQKILCYHNRIANLQIMDVKGQKRKKFKNIQNLEHSKLEFWLPKCTRQVQ